MNFTSILKFLHKEYWLHRIAPPQSKIQMKMMIDGS